MEGSECKNSEGVWPARFTLEEHAYGASHLPKTSENDYFAVYWRITIAVLKQLLKDKRIAFSATMVKKSELLQVFNTQAGYVTAYDGCFPKPKQFYFADKHLTQKKNQ